MPGSNFFLFDHPQSEWPIRALRHVVSKIVSGEQPGRINIFDAQLAFDLARLIPDLASTKYLYQVLSKLTVGDLFKGSIANFDLPAERAKQALAVRRQDELDQTYPAFCRSRWFDSWVAPDQFEELDKTVRAVEAAVDGHFDSALHFLGEVSLSYRRRNIAVVLIVEQFRRGMDCSPLQLSLRKEDLEFREQELLQMGLGCLGRVPWQGYPHPDY